MTGSLVEPTFLVVGAAKAGTTSLAAYLASHPDIYVTPQKELHFFDWDRVYARGWEWYCGHFEEAGGAKAVGEATPNYLHNPEAPERIALHLPGVQVVAILRNPVDRAYSQYWHLRGYHGEKRSFEETLDDPAMEVRAGYLSRGRYAEQLRRFHACFPVEQVHVVLFDDLLADPDATFAALCQRLGVPPVEAVALDEVHNQRFRLRSPGLRRQMVARRAWRRWPTVARLLERANRVPLTTSPMVPETRARLARTFAPANAELAALLGRDLSAWDR